MATIVPLQSLTQIQHDIPEWLERIDTLVETVNARYAQWVKEAEQSERPPSLKKGKTGSMESLRPRDNVAKPLSPEPDSNVAIVSSIKQPPQSSQPATPQAAHVDLDPHNRNLFKEVREQRKKRKDPSIKDGASGPPRSRLKGNFTIWYDASVQSGFETLVRNISSARNTLRKAKTAASFKTRLSQLENDESPYSNQAAPIPFQIGSVPRLSQPGSSYLTGLKTGFETYDEVDRELETAQTLCEVGAHQFLRDGDCFDELQTTRAKVQGCADRLATEIESLRGKDELDKVLRSSSSDKSPIDVGKTPTQRTRRGLSDLDPDSIAIDGLLEVDDNSDQESIEIDLLKLPGRRHYSSRHLMMSRLNSKTSDPPHAENSSEDGVQSSSERSGGTGRGTVDAAAAVKNRQLEIPVFDKAVDDRILVDSGFNIASGTETEEKTEDLDLAAMRQSIGQSASIAIPVAAASEDDGAPENALDVETSAIAVDSGSDLDLAAMRNSIGSRTRLASSDPVDMSQVASIIARATSIDSATNASKLRMSLTDDTTLNGSVASTDESDLDLAAMRASIERRASKLGDFVEPAAYDMQQHIKIDSIPNLNKQNSKVQTAVGNHDPDGNEIPMVPDLAIDVACAAEEEDEPDISPDMANILKNIRRAGTA